MAASTFARLPRPEQRCFEHALTGWRPHLRTRAVDAAVLDGDGTHRRALRRSERHRPAGEDSGTSHHARIVGVADEQRGAGRELQNLALGIGDRIGRRKEAEMRVANVRPHANVRFRDLDQSADLSSVVHAQFHDRHIRPGALHQ